VVVLSSLTPRNSELALKALDLGAVEVLCKPGAAYSTKDIAQPLAHAIRSAAAAKIPTVWVKAAGPAARPAAENLLVQTTHKVIAIGASTGGTKAIEAVLTGMPATAPGIVIVQHMPESFTASFAKRLDTLSQVRVIEAHGGERIEPGHAYLAPGHSHLLVKRSGGGYVTELSQEEPVNRHRPAADVLFRSVARVLRNHAIGVILTGMGKDGAQGLLEMRQAGAWTIGQNQESCVVYGMPREAALIGAVEEVVALSSVADQIMARLRAMDHQGQRV